MAPDGTEGSRPSRQRAGLRGRTGARSRTRQGGMAGAFPGPPGTPILRGGAASTLRYDHLSVTRPSPERRLAVRRPSLPAKESAAAGQGDAPRAGCESVCGIARDG
ncbi:MAG: hypothetical protein LBT40_07610 [Deltaproteobacteria bacterium]|nr:hypothetical protein [Deltaproteobacteria bacterium]